jgi:tetratricopeptide (TPR) repeat protein
MPDKSPEINIREEELFEKTPCLKLDVLLNYSDGNLSSEERYRVEQHLLDCQLCSLAVEHLPALENKEVIQRNVESVNEALRKQASENNTQVQDVRNAYFASAILILLQRSLRYRYAKLGAIIFSLVVLVSTSIITIRVLQSPTTYQISQDSSQIRSSGYDFFVDAEKLTPETPTAERYFAQAGQFANTAQYDSVIVYLTRASRLFEVQENWGRYVRCYNALAEYFRVLGDYRKARQYIDRAIEVGIDRLGKNHPEVVESFSLNGRIPGEP